MKKEIKEMIAEITKNGRLAKGFTQKELSELTNISIRSIQRIENAELIPRSYTLKTIAQVLEIPFAKFTNDETTEVLSNKPSTKVSLTTKLIISIAVSILMVLAALAFVSQSPKFPETNFEGFFFWSFVTIVMATFLYIVWLPKKPQL
jgi:transcriptional regulator with XRE-family HTH domain